MYRLCKVAARLGCRATQEAEVLAQDDAAPSSSHGAGQEDDQGAEQGEHDDADADDDDDGEDDVDYDELGMSQLDDEPEGTQESSTIGCPHRTSKPVNRYTPGTYALGRGKRSSRCPR